MKNSTIAVLSGIKAQKWIDTLVANLPFLSSIRVSTTDESSGTVTMLDMEDYGLKKANKNDKIVFTMENNRTVAYTVEEIVYSKLISDSDLEDMGINPAGMENLNGADGKKIADVIAKAFGKNFQDLVLNGDDSITETTGRKGMLKQKDGVFVALDAASRVLTDATLDTAIKEIKALYEAYVANEQHSEADRIWVDPVRWAQLVAGATSTSHQLTYAAGKLFYIDTEVVKSSNMKDEDDNYRMLIGNPTAVVAKIKREIKIEIGRSMEYRAWAYLITTRIDWPILPEFFYGLTHTAA